MEITFKVFEPALQWEAAVLLSIEKYESVTEADIVNDNKAFLDNWKKYGQLEESMIQKAIQQLIEKEALIKWERSGNEHIYSKSYFFDEVAEDVLDVLFEAIDFDDENSRELDDLAPNWVISWREEEICFDFDLLERLVWMYVKLNKQNGVDEMKHLDEFILANYDKGLDFVSKETNLPIYKVKEILLSHGISLQRGRITMAYFNNFDFIKENAAKGVQFIAEELSLPADRLRDFMIVNEILIVD